MALPASGPDLLAPWYRPWSGLIRRIGNPGNGVDWLARLNAEAEQRGLCNGFGHPLRFEPDTIAGARAKVASDRSAYELRIARTGKVPTRIHGDAAWHDYFNALAWLNFPQTKSQLNRRQALDIEANGVADRRGALRDALTLFDESAAVLLCADDAPIEDLRSFRWRTVFVDARERFAASASCVVFGHSLLQKLASPYKSICAHALVLSVRSLADIAAPQESAEQGVCVDTRIDAATALRIAAPDFGKSLLTPLPLLAIPGWWPPNEVAEFYNDPQVFRHQRQAGRERVASGPLQGSDRAAPTSEESS